jgi:ABC-type hemin transport system ATPase subunit
LRNFTVFEDAEFTFTPGVNAFVGENGTGKTHVLKALYAFQFSLSRHRRLQEVMGSVFQIKDPGLLIRDVAPQGTVAEGGGQWGEMGWAFAIHREEYNFAENHNIKGMPRPVFIPAVDMMGHTRRFVSTFDEYEIDFDQTHRDIVSLLLSPEQRRANGSDGLSETLGAILGGSVEEESERFYLRTPQGRQPMPLVAEGLRKIATLHQLVRNGWLRSGSVLFWDEPEVNLNPILMDEVVGALFALARSGVQVFLATHSFVILKELDLQSEAAGAPVRYFAFAPTDNGTTIHAADDYALLHPNPISEQFDRLYDLELARATRPKAPR